jgi:hypothetical protein
MLVLESIGVRIMEKSIVAGKWGESIGVRIMVEIETSFSILNHRVYAQTHVFKMSVCKGSQWTLFVATLGLN